MSSAVKSRKVSFSLGNKWQLKLSPIGNLKERKINDFFNISSGISYDYEQDNGFSDISHTLTLKPNNIKFGIVDLSTRPKGSFSQGTYDLGIHSWNPREWELGVKNWDLNVTSSFKLSGDANYVDYFPLAQNEFVSATFKGCKNQEIIVGSIYRPPDSDQNQMETLSNDIKNIAKSHPKAVLWLGGDLTYQIYHGQTILYKGTKTPNQSMNNSSTALNKQALHRSLTSIPGKTPP